MFLVVAFLARSVGSILIVIVRIAGIVCKGILFALFTVFLKYFITLCPCGDQVISDQQIHVSI